MKKRKSRRNEREVLDPVNGDARAFLRKWGGREKVPLEPGHFLCQSCGADFDNQYALTHHCVTSHPSLYQSASAEKGASGQMRCRICGEEMKDTVSNRKAHLKTHESKEVSDFCKLPEVPNLFEKF
jgi:hypothetical protein